MRDKTVVYYGVYVNGEKYGTHSTEEDAKRHVYNLREMWRNRTREPFWCEPKRKMPSIKVIPEK